MGVFDGEIAGETMEGTFHDAEGAGSFRLQKQIAWDALRTDPEPSVSAGRRLRSSPPLPPTAATVAGASDLR